VVDRLERSLLLRVVLGWNCGVGQFVVLGNFETAQGAKDVSMDLCVDGLCMWTS
jgi:hypothetical protein